MFEFFAIYLWRTTNSVTIHDEIPIPPSQGWIVFQTPSAPKRIFWPIPRRIKRKLKKCWKLINTVVIKNQPSKLPSSIKNSGIPSNTNIIIKGIRNAPVEKRNYSFMLLGVFNFYEVVNNCFQIFKIIKIILLLTREEIKSNQPSNLLSLNKLYIPRANLRGNYLKIMYNDFSSFWNKVYSDFKKFDVWRSVGQITVKFMNESVKHSWFFFFFFRSFLLSKLMTSFQLSNIEKALTAKMRH